MSFGYLDYDIPSSCSISRDDSPLRSDVSPIFLRLDHAPRLFLTLHAPSPFVWLNFFHIHFNRSLWNRLCVPIQQLPSSDQLGLVVVPTGLTRPAAANNLGQFRRRQLVQLLDCRDGGRGEIACGGVGHGLLVGDLGNELEELLGRLRGTR